MSRVFVAKRNAYVSLDGNTIRLKKGVSRIAANHALVKAYPDLFEPADAEARFDVRDTTARPVIGTPSAYSGMNKSELKAEIIKRNEGRADEDLIRPASDKNPDLQAALDRDDTVQAAKNDTGDPADPSDAEQGGASGAGDVVDYTTLSRDDLVAEILKRNEGRTGEQVILVEDPSSQTALVAALVADDTVSAATAAGE